MTLVWLSGEPSGFTMRNSAVHPPFASQHITLHIFSEHVSDVFIYIFYLHTDVIYSLPVVSRSPCKCYVWTKVHVGVDVVV